MHFWGGEESRLQKYSKAHSSEIVNEPVATLYLPDDGREYVRSRPCAGGDFTVLGKVVVSTKTPSYPAAMP